jgi:hypothetical protein
MGQPPGGPSSQSQDHDVKDQVGDYTSRLQCYMGQLFRATNGTDSVETKQLGVID